MPSSSRSSPARPPTSSRPSPGSAIARSAPEPVDDGPLSDAVFARLIAPLGPFERAPHLALAVSGGPDSMALCLLANRWARARGGVVTALTVDHGLRLDSAAEAQQVRAWLASRAIQHEILVWRGEKPASGIQAAARAARYELLGAWCRQACVLHLLLAHHLDDQAETVALRQARGSGPDGLAGMAAVRELAALRLLRPLLGVPKARLVATLAAVQQPWLEDPSNRDATFARGRLRLAGGHDAAGLARVAVEHGRQRADLDRRVAAWLVDAARIDPAGFLVLCRARLRDAEAKVARRAVEQALGAIGGRAYAPRAARLQSLLDALRVDRPWRGRTLAGCRIVVLGDRLLICREPGSIHQVVSLRPGVTVRWDERFSVTWRGSAPDLVVRALGRDGLAQRRRLVPLDAARDLPAPVRPGLPSIWRGEEMLLAPYLALVEPGFAGHVDVDVSFRPGRALAGPEFAGFAVVAEG